MKKQELKKLRDKEVQELRKELSQVRKNLALSRLDKVAGKLKNVYEVKTKQRQLAAILTLIKEKELLEKLQDGKKAKIIPPSGKEGKKN